MPEDPLQRFVQAQQPVFDQVCRELAAASKRTHWMWFVFPQLRGLGRSATALHYGIASASEALAYAQHALLGPRLLQTSALLLQAPPQRSALDILGSPDDLKLHSCMTLFNAVAPQQPVFAAVLQRFWNGQPDAATLVLLQQQQQQQR